MAEAGSIAERVKQQADIVAWWGSTSNEKGWAEFPRAVPIHSEKSPSFNVHPVRQLSLLWVWQGWGRLQLRDGDGALRVSGVAGASGGEVRDFHSACQGALAGKTAKESGAPAIWRCIGKPDVFCEAAGGHAGSQSGAAYLEDRGLDNMPSGVRHRHAPSGGDALLRHFKSKYAEKVLTIRADLAGSSGGRSTGCRRRITSHRQLNPAKSWRLAHALWARAAEIFEFAETPIYSQKQRSVSPGPRERRVTPAGFCDFGRRIHGCDCSGRVRA